MLPTRLRERIASPTLIAAALLAAADPAFCEGQPPSSDHHRSLAVSEITSLGEDSLRGVDQAGVQEVWVSGTEGTVQRSVDGGATWQAVAPAGTEALDFRDIAILEPGTVLLMSVGPGSSSRIYKTTDDAETWRLTFQNETEGAFFNGIDFWDSRSGVLTSDSTDGRLLLLRTDDAGETWTRIGSDSLPELRPGEAGFAASGTGIVTLDEHVWVGTGGAAARVFHSPDGGESWGVFDSPLPSGQSSTGIFSLAFRDTEVGVVVGGDYLNPEIDSGNIAWTEDGGRTWQLAARTAPVEQKACVRFLDHQLVLASGRSGLVASEDAGRTWRPLVSAPYYAFDFDQASGTGFLVGSEGRVGRLVVTRPVGTASGDSARSSIR